MVDGLDGDCIELGGGWLYCIAVSGIEGIV